MNLKELNIEREKINIIFNSGYFVEEELFKYIFIENLKQNKSSVWVNLSEPFSFSMLKRQVQPYMKTGEDYMLGINYFKERERIGRDSLDIDFIKEVSGEFIDFIQHGKLDVRKDLLLINGIHFIKNGVFQNAKFDYLMKELTYFIEKYSLTVIVDFQIPFTKNRGKNEVLKTLMEYEYLYDREVYFKEDSIFKLHFLWELKQKHYNILTSSENAKGFFNNYKSLLLKKNPISVEDSCSCDYYQESETSNKEKLLKSRLIFQNKAPRWINKDILKNETQNTINLKKSRHDNVQCFLYSKTKKDTQKLVLNSIKNSILKKEIITENLYYMDFNEEMKKYSNASKTVENYCNTHNDYDQPSKSPKIKKAFKTYRYINDLAKKKVLIIDNINGFRNSTVELFFSYQLIKKRLSQDLTTIVILDKPVGKISQLIKSNEDARETFDYWHTHFDIIDLENK